MKVLINNKEYDTNGRVVYVETIDVRNNGVFHFVKSEELDVVPDDLIGYSYSRALGAYLQQLKVQVIEKISINLLNVSCKSASIEDNVVTLKKDHPLPSLVKITARGKFSIACTDKSKFVVKANKVRYSQDNIEGAVLSGVVKVVAESPTVNFKIIQK